MYTKNTFIYAHVGNNIFKETAEARGDGADLCSDFWYTDQLSEGD